MASSGIPYSMEDYDAFLSSFNPNNQNTDKDQILEDPQYQVMSNPSISTSFSTDEDELAGINSLLMSPPYFNDQNNNLQGFRNDSLNSNDEFNLNGIDQISMLQNQQQQQSQFITPNFQFGDIKRESVTSMSSLEKHSDSESNISSELNSPVHQNQQRIQSNRIKLSKALPHQGSISKKNARKEKTSHNDIERKYRTNINDKIKALRNSVPALRVLVDSGDDELDDHLDGLQPAKKLNKATILSKATEYIKHLEAKNELLRKENHILKDQLNHYGISHSSSVSPTDTTDGRVFEDLRPQHSKTSTANKLLLGSLAFMVGSGLTDDMGNNDSRSLFSLPVISYDKITGFQGFNESFIILFKIGLIFTVLCNLIVPSLFQKKDEKKISSSPIVATDDVRNLKNSSIWSIVFNGSSNNDYLKNSVFRAVWLKVQFHNSNILIKSVVQVYIDHLWNYLQKIRLDVTHQDYDNLKLILSLPLEETINNEEYVVKFLNSDKLFLENSDDDTTVVGLLYSMVSESIQNSTLKNFIIDSVTIPNKSVIEISQELTTGNEELNLELQTLLTPNDSNIDKFQKTLESFNVSKLTTDDLLVYYAGLIQNLVYNKKDYFKAKHFFNKLDLSESKKLTLIGFTSLYMIVIAMTSNEKLYAHDSEISFKIEELSGLLRIWVSNSSGSMLKFKKRSLLIDYFVNVGLKLNGLDDYKQPVTN